MMRQQQTTSREVGIDRAIAFIFHPECFLGVLSTKAPSVYLQLDGVLETQTSRLLLSYYNNTAIEATALFVQQQVKGAIIADLYHVTPPHGGKWLLYWMIARELRQ